MKPDRDRSQKGSAMMIEFENKLPALNIDGRHNGTYNNEELGFPGILTTLDSRLGEFMHQLRNVMLDDRRLVLIDNRILMCSKNWIRDHVHEMKSFIHWEYDIDSFLNFIIETQREDGQFYELIKQTDDYHWKMVNPDCYRLYPEDNQTLVRLELEADIEYLVVEGVMYNYRVTGDTAWLARVLPALEKGIDYITSDPKRWDPGHGLVKRPFTIDTWDFCYYKEEGRSSKDRRINPDTPMSVMHGDNTGVYQAMRQLAFFNRRLGREEKALSWEKRAEELKENIFRYLYNGTFFTHQLHLNHPGIDDLESRRLSLSNAYALNRGILTEEQSRRMIDEYRSRAKTSGTFAEWFTIDPPYDRKFGPHGPGDYVNGAVSPFAAGELAKAAFRVGYAAYGWDIIQRFIRMRERDGTVYFLYSPVDAAPQNKLGPSAWGAGALLSAIDEGLAGVTDLDCGYRSIRFAPCFPVTEYTELRYVTGYEKTHTLVDIRYILKAEGLRYDLYSPAERIEAHIMLPKDKTAGQVFLNGLPIDFTVSVIGEDRFVDFTVSGVLRFSLEILFK